MLIAILSFEVEKLKLEIGEILMLKTLGLKFETCA